MPAGKHVGKPGVSFHSVKAVRLEPEPRTRAKPGIVDIDGEVIPFGSIEARAHPGVLRVLAI